MLILTLIYLVEPRITAKHTEQFNLALTLRPWFVLGFILHRLTMLLISLATTSVFGMSLVQTSLGEEFVPGNVVRD